MKTVIPRVFRLVPIGLCVVLVMGMLRTCAPSSWVTAGQNAAMMAVGLHAPREGVEYFENRRTDTSSSSVQTDAVVTPYASSVPSVYAGELYDVIETVIPQKNGDGGAVSETQIGGGTVIAPNVTVKNSSGVTVDPAWLATSLTFGETDGPQVLIVHTHATESYMSYYAGYYNNDDVTRSTDHTNNMIAVGEALTEQLRSHGIGVIHDTTLHDHPAYTGAYTRSEETIKRYLAAYPTIEVVLDIHRDALMGEDLTKVKPTATVNGRKAAQMMIVVGTQNETDAPNAYVRENLTMAMQLHQTLETDNEGLMRPMYLVNARYNQHLIARSLLVEVGTDANVLSEALYSARLLADALASMLQRK